MFTKSNIQLFQLKEVRLADEQVITMDIPMQDVARFTDPNDPNFCRIMHLIDSWIADFYIEIDRLELANEKRNPNYNWLRPNSEEEFVFVASTAPEGSRSQGVYIHDSSDSDFESTQSLQLNPDVISTFWQ